MRHSAVVQPAPNVTIRKPAVQIYLFESCAFLSIISLSWANELLDIPQWIFGGREHGDWHESALETAVTLLVWALVFAFTRSLLRRLQHAESFLRVCAWCHHVGVNDEKWVTLEEYFAHHLNTQTTHGICPTCAARLKAATPSGVP